MLKQTIILIVASILLISCGLNRKGVSHKPTSRYDGYSRAMQATDLYLEAIKAIIMGADTTQIIPLLKSVLKIDTTHSPSYYELATQYAPFNIKKAISYSNMANKLDSTNSSYRTQLGHLLIRDQQYDSALSVYKTLIAMAPDDPDNYRLMAALYEQSKQPFAAISMLDSAENRFGVIETISAYKRELLIGVKLYDKALSDLLKVVENYPFAPKNWVDLALLYDLMGKDSLSRNAFNRAQEIAPENSATIISLNEYYKKRGDTQNFLATARQLFNNDEVTLQAKLDFFKEITFSRKYYQENFFQIDELASIISRKYPSDTSVMELYAGHLIASGSLAEALKLYKTKITDQGAPISILNNIIDIESYLNHPDSVAKYATLSLKYYPHVPDFYIRKGSAMAYYMKDYKGAEAEYKLALKLAKTDSLKGAIYGLLGDNLYSMNDAKGCFKYYDKAIKYDTTNAILYNNYSYFLSLRNERLERALEMSQKAITLSPNNPTYLDTYGWVLYALQRYEEAKVVMRQAVSLDNTKSKELFFHYAEILYALGDNFMASLYWKKALENGYDPEIIERRLTQIK